MSWVVGNYDPIEQLEDNLWVVQGDLPGDMPLRRRMTVVRLAGHKLLLHSAIALQQPDMQTLEQWGEPAILVVPCGWHRLDAKAYQQRYPNIRVYCPKAAKSWVQRQVTITNHYDALPADLNLRVEPLSGVRGGEAVFVIKSPSGQTTLLFNDVIFNIRWVPKGIKSWILRLLGSTGGPKVTPLMRYTMVRNQRDLAHHLRQLAQEPNLARIIMSHGDVISQNPRQVLEKVAAVLAP